VAEFKLTELVDFGKKAIKVVVGRGANEAEAFLNLNSGTSIDIERGQIVRSIKRTDQGLGVRAVYDKAMGFSYTNTLTDKSVKETAERAFKAAKSSKSNSDWVKFPNPRSHGETIGTYDKKIVDLSSDELVETAVVMLSAVEDYDKRVLAVVGGVGKSLFSNVIVNSIGVEVFEVGTAIGCSMETIARDGTEVTPACFELNAERVYDIDPQDVGVEAARQAVSSLKAEKIGSGVLPVVFAQAAFSSLLSYTLINAVKADYIQRERSAFKGKIGKKVASELVTVYDDGLLEGGLFTRKFDAEGVPSQKTLVIDEGVLRNFLYDSYTANRVGAESTGNASRTGLVPYSSTPELEVTNFRFKGGDRKGEEIMEDIDEGLLFFGVQGAHSSNPESGEFSLVATPGWKIEKGEVVHAVRGVMLTGLFFDVLKNISALGSNIKKVGHLVAPWVRVDDVMTVGRL
jgi:PmbA protein